ncbi:hypothetical protein FOCC_FOCC000887 [Frankliniella occidentalis]|nr:hypothetical protein FOCC_FOCC000887 [Frankliniella occidentalis]
MAAPPRYPPARSDLILGLSDDEEEDDDDEEALDDSSAGGSGRDVGAEGLSTTPSTSSESGGSSLEARRTPPRPRVAKRSLRGELLERWPGWTSPARKRLRAASPARTAPARAAPDRLAAPFGWPQASSYPATSSSPGSTLAVGGAAAGAGLLVREYDRFWQLVEKIASSPSLVPLGPLARAADYERVCFVHVDDIALARRGARSSTPTKWRRHRRSPRRGSPSSSSEEESPCESEAAALPAPFLPDAPRSPHTAALAQPDDVLDGVLDEDLILPPPTPFSSPAASKLPRHPRPESPAVAAGRPPEVRRAPLADLRADAPAAPVAVCEDVVILPDVREQPPHDELL